MNSFTNHINNIKELITYFNDKNHKSKKKYKNYETLNTILKSFDTIAVIATTSSSFTLSLTGFGLIVIPISSSIACGLTFSKKLIYEIVMQKDINHKIIEKDQQTVKFSDKLNRKPLKDEMIDKNENELLFNIFTKFLDETKNESFL